MTYDGVSRIENAAFQASSAREAAGPGLSTTLGSEAESTGVRQAQEPGSSLFGQNDNHGRRVTGWLAGEDRSVDHEQVIGAIDLEIGVNYGRTTGTAIVATHLGRAHPVVRATELGRRWHIIDKVFNRLIGRWHNPLQVGYTGEGGLEVFDACDDSLLVELVMEVWRDGHHSVKGWRDGHAATRGGASAEVLGHCHGI